MSSKKKPAASIPEIVAGIHAHLRETVSGYVAPDPARAEDLAALEQAGAALPAELLEFYRASDGISLPVEIPELASLLTASEALEETRRANEHADSVAPIVVLEHQDFESDVHAVVVSGELRGMIVRWESVEASFDEDDAEPFAKFLAGYLKTLVANLPTPKSIQAAVARIAKAGARIRRLPDAGATTLYKCSTGTEIAVTKQSGEWSAILMSDRSTGWIPTRFLKFTGQSVDISTQVVAAASYSSAGDYSVRAGDGRWSSTNPMVAQALGWMGTPYVYGGTSRRGIDCSAMIQNSFRSCGYRLPRTAAEQARVGTPIAPSNLQPGDRLYFSASGTRVDHTGLYMGDGLFVHASGRGRSVIVSKLFDRRNWNIYTGARR